MTAEPVHRGPADATIVFAHGSRDPLWKRPVEAVTQRVAALAPACLARTAYLELTTPDLPTVVAEVVAELNSKSIAPQHGGCWTISIFPLFFGVGRHAREDLPAIVAQLRVAYPQVSFQLLPSAGEHDAVLDAAARAACGQ